jgi:hypothetical protein
MVRHPAFFVWLQGLGGNRGFAFFLRRGAIFFASAFCCFFKEQQLLKLFRALKALLGLAFRADKTTDLRFKDEGFTVEPAQTARIRRRIYG